MLKVGQIPYLNVTPFHYYWKDGSMSFVKGAPRLLGILARKGEIDLAPLPVVDGFLLEDIFEPLGNFGISVKNRVMSVLLFSSVPLEKLGGSSIAVTDESSTSRNLLRLLLEERYGLEGVTYDREDSRATLLIGDKALCELHGKGGSVTRPGRWSFCYDLASLWEEWTSLPFTFARWVVRRDLQDDVKRNLASAIRESLKKAYDNIEKISQEESIRLDIPADIVSSYLVNFNYELGLEEEKGISLFREKLVKAGILDKKTQAGRVAHASDQVKKERDYEETARECQKNSLVP